MAGLGFNHGWTRINTDLGLICVYPCPSVVGTSAVTEAFTRPRSGRRWPGVSPCARVARHVHFESEAAGLRARGLRGRGRLSSDLRMRPNIVIAALLLGGLLIGVMVLFRQGSGQPEEARPAFSESETNPGRAEARALGRGLPAAAGAVAATNLAPAPRHGEPEGWTEARQRAYVENRAAELMELASQDDPASINIILSELTNRDPEIRKAALEATLQVRSREAIPRLMEAFEQTDDPREKAAIADAIEFLRLPSLGEVMDQMGERATHAPAEAAGRAGHR